MPKLRYSNKGLLSTFSPSTGKRLLYRFKSVDQQANFHAYTTFSSKAKSPTLSSPFQVVSPPDQRIGRGLKSIKISEVKLFAKEHQLIVHDAPMKTLQGWGIPKPKDDENNDVSSGSFDIGIVVSFGYFLTREILDALPDAINIHPSLLPKYRGASPIQYSIMNGDKETGITIQELHPKIFDAGRILRQITLPIPPDSTYKRLETYLAEKGAELLIDTLRNFYDYKVNAQPQDLTQVTKAPKIAKEMSIVSWDKLTAEQVVRLDRAISHQPLTSTGKEEISSLPGTIFYQHSQESIQIVCANGTSMIGCTSVKMSEKKEIQVKDWINGYPIISGVTRFGDDSKKEEP
ncbi:11957_t:CDS:2 [Ambispora gerdemannii]|uniref:methionyl-tRNA formyltransferase n=1 Tax=Ambispora gerdemannii TaxID=144530 RepID=A0A9N8WF74_9GLOM|nr:11957_t:CDS:2 [Ambispora gerdemannii]